MHGCHRKSGYDASSSVTSVGRKRYLVTNWVECRIEHEAMWLGSHDISARSQVAFAQKELWLCKNGLG